MKNLWNKWKLLVKRIGDFQASLVFSIFFYIFATPVGLISNLFGDFLKIKSKPGWDDMEDNVSTFDKLRDQ